MSVEYISVKIAPRGEIKEGVRAKEKAKQRKPAKMEAKKKKKKRDSYRRKVEGDRAGARRLQLLCLDLRHLLKVGSWSYWSCPPHRPISNYSTGCERGSNKLHCLIHFSCRCTEEAKERRSERQQN